jgi:hypothetical protein
VSLLPIDSNAEFGISNVPFSYSSGSFDSHIGHALNNFSQREDGPAAEPFPPAINEHVHDLSNSTTLVDARTRLDFVLCSDYVAPVKSQTVEEGDVIFQNPSMSITKLEQSQSSSDIALESVSSAVKNDEIHSGKLIRSSLKSSC